MLEILFLIVVGLVILLLVALFLVSLPAILIISTIIGIISLTGVIWEKITEK